MDNIVKYHMNREDIVIDLTKSAPNQIKPFPRIKDLCRYWRAKGYEEVIDVGCGQLRNSLVLVDHFKLWICDFPQQLRSPTATDRLAALQAHRNFLGIIRPREFEKGRLTADASILAYVLHTLPERGMRARLVQLTIRNTRAPHEVFIAAPNGEYYYRQRMAEHNQFGDGHLFGGGKQYKTFYREYTAKQIDEFMRDLCFELDRTFPADKKNQRTYLKKKS